MLLSTTVVSAVVFAQEVSIEIPEKNIGEISLRDKGPVTFLFVGDIMLGRRVETMIKELGADYPFEGVAPILDASDLTIGNFEGVVNERHVHTPDLTFRFSVRKEYLEKLSELGFDVLSLANNHSFDYGADAFRFMRGTCTLQRLVCGGIPYSLDEDSLLVRKVGDHDIGFIFLSTVDGEVKSPTLKLFVDALKAESDFQIAYVHWGDEYKLTHNRSQERIAKKLIDYGVDLVVGHHPHVVQDAELYRDRLIFYSLGNFIFDQYFSSDVEEGLAVNLKLEGTSAHYSLVALSSEGSRSQPHPMSEEDAERLFARILRPLPDEILIDKEKGRIILPLE
jgi:poly-gamma-glutamate synthesis protein (capsule biosynthesis protein)